MCARRPRKSPRTEARAEFHVAGVVRDRSLSRFNQVSRGKSPLARPRGCSPQPAAARRSPPQPAQCRTQRRFHEDSGVLTLFCESESEGIPGIFAQNLPLWSLRPSPTVEMTKIPKIPGLFHYFFCWNLRNLPTESSSEMLASFTGRCTHVRSNMCV